MKKIYSFFAFLSIVNVCTAQIMITASDMPVSGDTLRYSTTGSVAGIDITTTGAGTTWDYSSLVAVAQRVDTYKTAVQVNPLYTLISPTAYGYKVADSFPGLGAILPVSVKGIYTFYNKKNSPARFIAEGFAATISGIPTPATYQDEDEIYFFPLDYGVTNDSSSFRLKFNLAAVGSMLQKGYRKTTVDGWGTIVTPFFTNPLNCIRVRSEIHEIDTIETTVPISFKFGIPRNTVEYKWLANGEHYPALWITTTLNGSTETVTSVRYRDYHREGLLSIAHDPNVSIFTTYPNPAKTAVRVKMPKGWKDATFDIYDITGKHVGSQNTIYIDIADLPNGKYMIVVSANAQTGYTWFVKE